MVPLLGWFKGKPQIHHFEASAFAFFWPNPVIFPGGVRGSVRVLGGVLLRLRRRQRARGRLRHRLPRAQARDISRRGRRSSSSVFGGKGFVRLDKGEQKDALERTCRHKVPPPPPKKKKVVSLKRCFQVVCLLEKGTHSCSV